MPNYNLSQLNIISEFEIPYLLSAKFETHQASLNLQFKKLADPLILRLITLGLTMTYHPG